MTYEPHWISGYRPDYAADYREGATRDGAPFTVMVMHNFQARSEPEFNFRLPLGYLIRSLAASLVPRRFKRHTVLVYRTDRKSVTESSDPVLIERYRLRGQAVARMRSLTAVAREADSTWRFPGER